MNPAFALWMGLFMGTLSAFVITGLAGLIGTSTGRLRTIFKWTWLACVLGYWVLNFSLIVWYNTPLGEPLNLER